MPTPAITAVHLHKRHRNRLSELFTTIFSSLLSSANGDNETLMKYYQDPKAAVRNVSFRVLPNEIFGLLGPNGAGKSTTMAMLTNEISPTAGLIHIDHYSTFTNWHQAQKLLGYCPQHDALWDELTVAEHLQLYAALRGKQSGMRRGDGRIYKIAAKLGLTEYWNVKSKALSGGTKRKLSFLISIIDDRNMTSLLDEPSSGMDPSSARYLWDIIKEHFKNRPEGRQLVSTGGILTTHYMEEAEALCDRIAIMVKGNIVCVGSPMHLRNKFGSGYRLELRLADGEAATRDLVLHAILQQFPEALLNEEESRLNRLVFSLPQHEALPLSRSFAFLESQRVDEQLEIELEAENSADVFGGRDGPNVIASDRKVLEYTITQASLEHVFLRFAAVQSLHDEFGKSDVAYND